MKRKKLLPQNNENQQKNKIQNFVVKKSTI